MVASTHELLDAFDRLPEAERLAFTVEILRRTVDQDLPLLDDEALISMADALFLELDAREEADAHRSSR